MGMGLQQEQADVDEGAILCFKKHRVIVALIVFKYCYKRWLAVVEQLQQQQQLGRGGEAALV